MTCTRAKGQRDCYADWDTTHRLAHGDIYQRSGSLDCTRKVLFTRNHFLAPWCIEKWAQRRIQMRLTSQADGLIWLEGEYKGGRFRVNEHKQSKELIIHNSLQGIITTPVQSWLIYSARCIHAVRPSSWFKQMQKRFLLLDSYVSSLWKPEHLDHMSFRIFHSRDHGAL